MTPEEIEQKYGKKIVDNFPSLKGQACIMTLHSGFKFETFTKEVVFETCIDKQRLKEALVNTMTREELIEELEKLGLND